MNHLIYILQDDGSEKEVWVRPGQQLCDIAAVHSPEAICARVSGRIVSLADEAKPEQRVQFLSPQCDELASRVFLRGAIFLLWRAVSALYPGRQLLVEHMLCGGVYCTMGALGGNELPVLRKRISEYIVADEAFVPKSLPLNEAKAALEAQGMLQRNALMSYQCSDSYKLYSFGSRIGDFFGVLPKSTSYLAGMRLLAYEDGFILKYPAPYHEAKRPIVEQKKYAAVFRQAEAWANVLNVSYVADLNRMVGRGEITDFIRVNEALHEKTIADIAANITGNPERRVVLIAGPSSSGKTTFASRLAVHLRVLGQKSRSISLDNYYKDRSDIPRDASGRLDFECLDALDVAQLNSDLQKLIVGDAANLPMFDFLTGKRCSDTECVKLNGEILILEGIHGLNDALTQGIPAAQKFKIYISPLTTLNFDQLNVIMPEDLRLLRRLVRDRRTRGYSFEQTFDVWDSVRRGEFLHILPYQETADVMFNSTLIYEPLILKKHCVGPLLKITPDMPSYARATGLLKILNVFLSLDDESEVPTRSILREFIG